MKKIFAWLLKAPQEPRRWWQVVLWWEVRRIPFNVIIVIFGSISLPIFYLFLNLAHRLKLGEDAIEPMALFIAPFLVNFFYTLGWISELLFRFSLGDGLNGVGPILFKLGLIFSVFIVFLPSIIWFNFWLWGKFR